VDLRRFKDAQDSPHSGFAEALDEIRAGRKTGHWIWYVFPQIAGLGMSPTSQLYAIDGEAEAVEYLRDPELRSRLLTISTAVADQLRRNTQLRLATLMGSGTDARKLVSSLTLFGHVASKMRDETGASDYDALARVATEVLDAASTQGYPPCAVTQQRLGAA
jgi:uncharacterized protein (DUF1810 family)